MLDCQMGRRAKITSETYNAHKVRVSAEDHVSITQILQCNVLKLKKKTKNTTHGARTLMHEASTVKFTGVRLGIASRVVS